MRPIAWPGLRHSFGRALLALTATLIVLALAGCEATVIGATDMTGAWVHEVQGVELVRLNIDDQGGELSGTAFFGASLDLVGQRAASGVDIGLYARDIDSEVYHFKGTVSGDRFAADVSGAGGVGYFQTMTLRKK